MTVAVNDAMDNITAGIETNVIDCKGFSAAKFSILNLCYMAGVKVSPEYSSCNNPYLNSGEYYDAEDRIEPLYENLSKS